MTDGVLETRDLTFKYPNSGIIALKNLNLKINKGDFIGLVGPNGSGKTTLLYLLANLYEPTSGEIYYNNKNIHEINQYEYAKKIGFIFQNPENKLIVMNVEHEIAFGLENLGIPPKEIARRIEESASLTEIEHILDKAPFELSGGEQQRVAIASILVLKPKILILDEPTALLDPYMAKKIINLLIEIQLERNLSVMISEHRLDLVIPYAEEMILMKEGGIIEHNSRDKVVNGINFQNLKLNKPVIYTIFNRLREENLFTERIPASIPDAIDSIKKLKIR